MDLQVTSLLQQAQDKFEDREYTAAHGLIKQAITVGTTIDVGVWDMVIELCEYSTEPENRDIIELANQGLTRFNTSPASYMLVAAKGCAYFCLKEYNSATRELTFALDQRRRWIKIRSTLARSLHEQQKYEQALRLFNETISEEPRYPFAIAGRGLTYHKLGHYQEAIADLTTMLDRNPGWIEGLLARGSSYYEMKVPEKGLTDFQYVLALSKDMAAEALYGRSLCYHDLCEYELAVEDLEHIVREYEAEIFMYADLASNYFYLQKYSEAIKAYDQCIKIEPMIEYYRKRGYIYQCMGKYELALKDYNAAQNLKPSSDVIGCIAYLYEHGYGVTKDEAKAFALYEEAYEMESESNSSDNIAAAMLHCYHEGIGVATSEAKIKEILANVMMNEHAKTDHSAIWQLMLSYLYYEGIYVKQDINRAGQVAEQAIKIDRTCALGWYYLYVLERGDLTVLKQKVQKFAHTSSLVDKMLENVELEPEQAEYIYPFTR